jgi:hypothetical protein
MMPTHAEDRRAAVERWLAGIRGAPTPEIIHVDDPAVLQSLPRHAFYVVRFRQYPVAPALPESLQYNNLLVVGPDGRAVPLSGSDALQAVFRAALRPATSRQKAETALTAWLRLVQEFYQDGFFHFEPPRGMTWSATGKGGQVTGHTLVLPDAADRGGIEGTLKFDRAGKLVSAIETSSVTAGHRPI